MEICVKAVRDGKPERAARFIDWGAEAMNRPLPANFIREKGGWASISSIVNLFIEPLANRTISISTHNFTIFIVALGRNNSLQACTRPKTL